jgi:hypothetical protein
VAAPDIDKSSSVPLDRTVCIADKELAGREGAGRRRRSAHLRCQWETETANRYEQLDQFESRMNTWAGPFPASGQRGVRAAGAGSIGPCLRTLRGRLSSPDPAAPAFFSSPDSLMAGPQEARWRPFRRPTREKAAHGAPARRWAAAL